MKPSSYYQMVKRMRDRAWCLSPAWFKRFWLDVEDKTEDSYGC